MVDSVNKARLHVATVALIRQKYPEDLAEVILDDTSLPAWEEATAQAAAVIASLQLGGLFERVNEVNAIIADHDSARKLAEKEAERLNREMESEVANRVFTAVRAERSDYQEHIRQLEDDLYEAREDLLNIRAGVEVKRNIKRYGKVYSVDTDIMQDDNFDLDYENESYRKRYEW